jgi:phenylacetate-CoA ligase
MIKGLLQARKLRRSWRMPPSSMEELQAKKLRSILRYAYFNVPFYHRKFDKAGVKPDDIKTVDDLKRIPPTTKDEIRAIPIYDLVAKNFDVKKCKRDITSGSSGVPLTTYMDREALDFYSAVWIAVFFENGVKFWDKKAIIGEPRNFPKEKNWTEYFGIMPHKYISIFDDAQAQLGVLRAYRPDIIEGYPSSLSIIADVYRRQKGGLKPRLIFTLAETLDKVTRKFITSSFEADLLDYYGSSEFSLIAWECSQHFGYHINANCLVVEFLRNGDSVGGNERGEITCTSLVNYAMPLIRYRHGDIGIPLREPCLCGMTLPLMKVVEGRADDFLTALDGRIISPTVFFPYPFKDFARIRQFRVIQEKREELKIQLVVDGNCLAQDVLRDAKREIQRVFGEEMQVEFEFLDELKRDPSGKIKKIESHVPVRFW